MFIINNNMSKLISPPPSNLVGIAIIAIFWLIYGSILYYIYYLEQEKCKCVKTWHHNFIKYSTVVLFILPIIAIFVLAFTENNLIYVFTAIYIAIFVIYIYAIYAYVNKLNNTQCSCAVHDMKYIHNTLYYIFNAPKFIFRLVFMLVLLFLVILIVMLIGNVLFYGGDAFISWVKKPAKF